MSRHIARELAFLILFETDIGRNPWQEVLSRTIAENELPEQSRIFLEQLVKGTIQQLQAIDAEIMQYAQDWKLERMANTDRNILRMAIYEIKYLEDIPPGVTINEAVELSKRYGDDESGKFVNGILGNLVRSKENITDSKQVETRMED
jgi:transcription antitermination protein NusB